MIYGSQIVKLKAFSKFENTTEALAAATALVDSKLGKGAFIAPPSGRVVLKAIRRNLRGGGICMQG